MTKKKASDQPQEPTRKSARLVAMKKKAAAKKASTQRLKTTPKSTSITKGNLGHCSRSSQFPPRLPDGKRPRKCRTIEELVTVPLPESPALRQDGQNPALKEYSTRKDEQARSPPQEQLPPGYAVELLLETLEKSDTYNIFSEPVDPMKVPGYYRSIKEPMDFATIRAKLQKRSYKSLQELEHDVFLISDNAMKFNPSTTIFYREARQLREMAKEAFIALRSDLKAIEANNAQRSAEHKRRHGVVTETAGTMNSGGLNFGGSAAGRAGSSFSKALETCTGQGDIVYSRRSRNRSDSANCERRNTYNPWTSLNGNGISNASDFASKELVPANDIGSAYTESSMRFVQDLGPTAKRIAHRKLRGLCEGPLSQQELARPDPNFSILPSEDTAMLLQTPLSIDGYGNNANAGTCDIVEGLESSCANMDLFGITLRHDLARKLLKEMTPSTAESVATALGSFLPARLIDWYITTGKYPSGYNVQVTKLNSSMPTQQGYGHTGSMTTMHNIFSSSKLDKGKNIVSYSNVNYGGGSGQRVMLGPLLAENEGNMNSSQLCGEQFPGLNAMTQQATHEISTVPSMHAGSSNSSFLGFQPQSSMDGQELDLGLQL